MVGDCLLRRWPKGDGDGAHRVSLPLGIRFGRHGWERMPWRVGRDEDREAQNTTHLGGSKSWTGGATGCATSPRDGVSRPIHHLFPASSNRTALPNWLHGHVAIPIVEYVPKVGWLEGQRCHSGFTFAPSDENPHPTAPDPRRHPQKPMGLEGGEMLPL